MFEINQKSVVHQSVGGRMMKSILGGVCVAMAFAASVVSAPAHAATEYPTKPVRIVVPFPPGAANDAIVRGISEKLSQRWGQPVIVENKPGGSSIIGTSSVAEATPDGHTLLANVALMIQNPLLRKNLPYDPAKLTPVTQINRQQLIIVVNDKTPAKNLAELKELASQRPGQLNYATFGIGSTAHMMLEKFAKDNNVDLEHVPYKGSGDVLRALLADEVQVAVMDPLTPREYFANGSLRPIAVTGPERVSLYPDVQTMKEAGVEGFSHYNWLGLFAPTGTPEDVIVQISDAFNEAQKDPKLQKWFEDMAVLPSNTTPAEFRAIYDTDSKIWAEVIQATGITVE